MPVLQPFQGCPRSGVRKWLTPSCLWRNAVQLVVLASLCLGLAMPASARYRQLDLPDLGDPADTALPPAKAKKLGEEAFDSFRRHGAIEEDPELSTYIRKLGHRLASHTGHDPDDFHYFVVEDNTINSFALPGDYIGIQTGLIAATRNVSELAAVMAHETAHEVQNHIARRLQEQHVLNWETGAAIVAAILAGGASPEAVSAGLGAGASSYYQRSVNFTRSEEFEADRVGIRILAASGFDPYGMVTFFQRLEQQSRLYGSQIPPILIDHPVDSVRMAEAQFRAEQYPKRKLPPSLEYQLMRARDEVLAAEHPSDAVARFRQLHAEHPDDPAMAYGEAVALARVSQLQQAGALLHELIAKDPDEIHYQLALARIDLADGQPSAAVTRLAHLVHRHPDYPPATLAYADALIQVHQPTKARAVLLSVNVPLANEPKVQQLLAVAAAAEGRRGEAYYAQAQYDLLEGDRDLAIHQLSVALRLPDLTANERARIRAKLAEIKQSDKS